MDDPEQDVAPQWSNLVYLLTPSCLILIGLAVSTVLIGALRSSLHDIESRKKGISEDSSIVIDHRHAILFPVVGSISLLLFFYIFTTIQFVLVLILCISAASGLVFALKPAMMLAAHNYPILRQRVTLCRTIHSDIGQVLLATLAGCVLTVWLSTGSFICHNILGMSLCISFISYVKLPNLKVSCLI